MGQVFDIMQILRRCIMLLAETAGIWKILEKCGKKGWWALIPGGRYLKLGEAAGRGRDGRVCMVLEIFLLIADLAGRVIDIFDLNDNILLILTFIGLAAVLTMMIHSIRVYGGLCQTFNVTKYWVVGWFLASTFTALFWGFRRSFQPVNLGRDNDDDLLAGMTPALFGGPELVDTVEESLGEGLEIRLKDRSVSDFLKKRYLLKDIALTIPNGSLVLLLGGSGAGKTTFVNAITGYEKANAEILLNGQDIYKKYEEMKYRIGFVPQQDLLRMNDTVISTLQDAATLRLPTNVDHEETQERLNSVMDTLGLTAGRNGLVSKKSGGQKKRISIGMELISDPDLFILDEPDSGLDGVIARELFTKLREIADEGKIVIAITHTPDRVIDLFDKVIVLARDSGRVGRLAFYGSPDEARAFFGKRTMEEIVMAINRKGEGGEGRADEFIAAYAAMKAETAEQAELAEHTAGALPGDMAYAGKEEA